MKTKDRMVEKLAKLYEATHEMGGKTIIIDKEKTDKEMSTFPRMRKKKEIEDKLDQLIKHSKTAKAEVRYQDDSWIEALEWVLNMQKYLGWNR